MDRRKWRSSFNRGFRSCMLALILSLVVASAAAACLILIRPLSQFPWACALLAPPAATATLGLLSLLSPFRFQSITVLGLGLWSAAALTLAEYAICADQIVSGPLQGLAAFALAIVPAAIWSLWIHRQQLKLQENNHCEVCLRTPKELKKDERLIKFPNPECKHWICSTDYPKFVKDKHSQCQNGQCQLTAIEL